MKTERAIFAAGCFWGVEEAFTHIPGVISTIVGYTGGNVANPSYEQVCSHTTGHAEAVEVTFDPQKITYKQLLNKFWEIHDPTTLNRQGPDIGSNYRSAIFYLNDEQKKEAQESKYELEKSNRYKDRLVTEITKAGSFYRAEEYHQKYYHKHNISSISCPIYNNLENKPH